MRRAYPMKGHVPLQALRVFGAPVYLHWSAVVALAIVFALSVRQPVLAIVSACAYFGIVLVHEVGHALVAWKLGYAPISIRIGFLHGECCLPMPRSEKESALIAWGGAAAQLAIAIPVIAVAQLMDVSKVPGAGPVVAFLGYFSAMFAVINLAPARGFDGQVAWRLVPIVLAERRAARRRGSNVTRGPWR